MSEITLFYEINAWISGILHILLIFFISKKKIDSIINKNKL